MSEQNELNPAERELEEALKSLAPTAARIDPVSAAFEAGRRSARRQLQVWRVAAAAALMIGIGSWLVPIGARIENRTPVVAVAATPMAPALAPQSVFVLQAAMREHGVAGLPPTLLPKVGSGHPTDVL